MNGRRGAFRRPPARRAGRDSRAGHGNSCGPTGFEHIVVLRLAGAIHSAAGSQSGAGRAGAGRAGADGAEPAAQSEPQEIDEAWPAEAPAPSTEPPESDLIYQRMLSEFLVDPHDLGHSADLDWKTVWDHGWSAAAEVENVPVQAHTDHGLPVRDPGARLVPGGAGPEQNGAAHHRADEDNGAVSNGGLHSGRKPAHEAPVRDPEAIRASMSSHFGGVRAGRSHARDTDQGPDHE